MKYFNITLDIAPQVVGINDGGYQVRINRETAPAKEQYNRMFDLFKAKDYGDSANLKPEFSVSSLYAEKRRSAKLTDILSYAPYLRGCPFMINKNCCNLLKQFILPEYYIFPVDVYFKNKHEGSYYLFNIPILDVDVVDFAQSSFYDTFD